MSKSFAVGTAIGLACSAIVGVAAGIMMVGSPQPTPRQSPAAVVQQLDPTTDTGTPTTTMEQPTVTTSSPQPPTAKPTSSTTAEPERTEPAGAVSYGPPAPAGDQERAVMPDNPPDAFVAPSPTPIVTPQNPPGVIETH